MYYYQNSIGRRMGKEKIRYWFIFLVFTMFLCPSKSTAESNYQKPLVYLNHVYLTLDSSTYFSICDSGFLKDNFGYCHTKTVNAGNNRSWTGTYLYGQNTYIEFFVTTEAENKGYSGIGFGIETENGIDSLYENFTRLGIKNIAKGLSNRQVEDNEIPWFYWFGFSNQDSTATYILNTWLMEYKYEYMGIKYPDKDPDSLKITRKFYLQKEYRSDLLLQDIVEIELALDEADHSKIFEELKSYGYQFEQQNELIIGNGPDIRIILRAKSENKSGICRIKFSLTDMQYEQQTVLFGDKSKLTLNADRTAEWYFDI